ncbi:MAG: phosphoribosylformylglycinamidine synthase subunit PurL [Dehalococcoidales bacterium]|jgi:phosphoribosylformylglycinamidine synthase|nr:phosphoribosylformylglycinamidine synthase subunit PurL [Dehalococcoidales bacterium]MDD4322840.1 phosphoribosylformylglycinamidine synthase subunit PurL [Dehalococcoidales bacterium]MDD4794555.1 phosphoribosylformylglycinamidine synthase subunit PurL [Dehalococcoidales bacterium]MDX9803610.1 phosphoribosylformylglycinamidine synthase subunit PurL [Dehalococcoidales bacterium]
MQRIEVSLKSQLPDTRGHGLVKDIYDLGVTSITHARVHDVYYIRGNSSRNDINTVCNYALADPLIHDVYIGLPDYSNQDNNCQAYEVTYNPGVTDPIEESILKSIRDLGIDSITGVKTATRYELYGKPTEPELQIICSRLLVNPTVQHIVTGQMADSFEIPEYKFQLKTVDILNASPAELSCIAGELGFSEAEIKAILNYYHHIGRNPTDAELETLAQTWSEHCGHKTFKARYDFNGTTIDGLLKSTIMRATQELDKPWCLSVFKDNAGVISFDENWALAFKVETHNHPSAIEPYGGAATGVGGVVRDVLGTGLGAKPIANTDVFCFGQPDLPYEKLPEGTLHPRRILKGVRSGVADYGNRLGIPTVNGAICFDERYTANPLVYCGTVGIMPVDAADMGQQKSGDKVVLVGGRTGRDGIHGVTFASAELNLSSTEECQSSVQIGNAIAEKKVIDAILEARDKKLFRRITDCGGGGLSSAIGEMAENTGVKVYLDKVPLKYSGLNYSEIWISESQERMLLAVPPECVDELSRICTREGTEATVIGEFTSDRMLTLYYQGNQVCNLDMEFLHNGLPRLELKATYTPSEQPASDFTPGEDLGSDLKKVLSTWNTCSREWIIRQYDHEVQGGSVLKPLGGISNDGPRDAAVIRPVPDSNKGIIISNGINPGYGDIDPYWMAASAIEEALRQIIAVGGNLDRVALLDNFSWGSAKKAESLGALVRACQACYDLAMAYETPFISGKDSLNNEYEHEGEVLSIPHTLLISALAVVDDTSKIISQDFKKPGNLIYLVGSTRNEMGGSEYFKARNIQGGRVPRLDVLKSADIMNRLSTATDKRMLASCHDLSDGGLGVALAEMAFSGGLGTTVDLGKVPTSEQIDSDHVLLFSQSNSRFLCEVTPGDSLEFEKLLYGLPFACIGSITESPRLIITGTSDMAVVDEDIASLKEAWQKPLNW